MAALKHIHILFTLLLLKILLQVHDCFAFGGSVSVQAILYEKADKTGENIKYFRRPSLWNALPTVFNERGIANIELICIRGAWVAYEEQNFIVDTSYKVAIVAGNSADTCVEFSTLGFKQLGSMQPISGISNYTKPTITFFTGAGLDGSAMRVTALIKPANVNPKTGTVIKSLTTVGKNQWTVGLLDGTKLCIKPSETFEIPACFLSQFVKNQTGAVTGVKRGCKVAKGPFVDIELTSCVEIGGTAASQEVTTESTPEDVTEGPEQATTNAIDPAPPSQAECDHIDQNKGLLDEELKQLVLARLNGSLASGEWLKGIKNPKNIWKVELFDRVYKIFTAVCPSSVIDIEYMQIFSALYMHHLDKVWEENKFINTSITQEKWHEINYDMGSCALSIAHNPRMSVIEPITTRDFHNYVTLEEIRSRVEDTFGLRPDFDHIMEINYMMMNMVASACYQTLNYDVNFLPRFLSIYHELYFLPIMEQWATPGKFPLVYQYIFGGFGMDKSLLKIGMCASYVLSETSVVEPYTRPMEQENKSLLPKSLD